MSLGDGFRFAYICILPPRIRASEHANAGPRLWRRCLLSSLEAALHSSASAQQGWRQHLDARGLGGVEKSHVCFYYTKTTTLFFYCLFFWITSMFLPFFVLTGGCNSKSSNPCLINVHFHHEKSSWSFQGSGFLWSRLMLMLLIFYFHFFYCDSI